MLRLTNALREKWMMNESPEFSSFVTLRRERIDQIDEIKRISSKAKMDDQEDATTFHSLLKSELPNSEKTSARLAEGAVLLVGAGTHTTSWTLSVVTFHLLSTPKISRKLRVELETAIPDPSVSTPLPVIEALPYLTAVIKEGLQLSFGITSRIPRVALDQPIEYVEHKIAPGTPVSMTIPIVHFVKGCSRMRSCSIRSAGLKMRRDIWINIL
jgi:cytochrome P450